MRTEDHKQIWKIMRRFSNKIRLKLDHYAIDQASTLQTMESPNTGLTFELVRDEVRVSRNQISKTFEIEDFLKQPTTVFREISQILEGS